MGTLFAKSPVSNEMKKVNPFIGYALEEEPAEWREMRENLHTNPDDQFFLLRSGAIDGIAFKNCVNHTLYLYGGENGDTLLYQTTITTNSINLRNYFILSDLKGKKYIDKDGIEYELFAIIMRLKDNIAKSKCANPGYTQAWQSEVPLLEYAGNSIQAKMFGYPNDKFSSPYLEYAFLGDKVSTLPDYAMYGTRRLKKLTIKSKSPLYIGQQAFIGSNIQHLDLTVSNVQVSVFGNGIRYLKLKFVGGGDITVSDIFSNCANLNTLILDTTELNSLTIDNLKGAELLTKLELPNNARITGDILNCMSMRELIYNGNLSMSCNLQQGPSLEILNMPTLRVPKTISWYGGYYYPSARGLLGTKGTIPGTSSPTLGLETPILIDFENSFTSSGSEINFRYCCLTLDMLKAIFDYLPVVTNGSFKCGYQYFKNESGVWTSGSNQIYTQFLAWFNTLTTEQKKGWSVATG